MAHAYPDRPMMPRAARIACMVFGALGIGGLVLQLSLEPSSIDFTFAILGTLVGGLWFGFGWYGGLPLVDTVADWTPPKDHIEVTAAHRAGLRVILRRRWIGYLVPLLGAVAAAFTVVPPLMEWGHPEMVMLVLAPLGIFPIRDGLNRCPRCGFGFYAVSTSRAALLRHGSTCGHCGLSLDEGKAQ